MSVHQTSDPRDDGTVLKLALVVLILLLCSHVWTSSPSATHFGWSGPPGLLMQALVQLLWSWILRSSLGKQLNAVEFFHSSILNHIKEIFEQSLYCSNISLIYLLYSFKTRVKGLSTPFRSITDV